MYELPDDGRQLTAETCSNEKCINNFNFILIVKTETSAIIVKKLFLFAKNKIIWVTEYKPQQPAMQRSYNSFPYPLQLQKKFLTQKFKVILIII
jgi:hypothetical protein